MNLMLRLSANFSASNFVPGEEYCDGMDIPTTLSGPNASTAITAVKAESIPPLKPITTFLKPFFLT